MPNGCYPLCFTQKPPTRRSPAPDRRRGWLTSSNSALLLHNGRILGHCAIVATTEACGRTSIGLMRRWPCGVYAPRDRGWRRRPGLRVRAIRAAIPWGFDSGVTQSGHDAPARSACVRNSTITTVEDEFAEGVGGIVGGRLSRSVKRPRGCGGGGIRAGA